MLASLLSTALTFCLAGGGVPTKEEIAAWVVGLGGANDAVFARQLSAAWPHARQAVALALETGEMPSVRSWCARILGDHAGASEDQSLARAAQRDGAPLVRSVALRELAKHGGTLYIETLGNALEWESDRSNLISMLGLVERTGNLALVEPLLGAIELRFKNGPLEKLAFATLRRLTKAKLPNDVARWRNWWEAQQTPPADEEDSEEDEGGGGGQGAGGGG